MPSTKQRKVKPTLPPPHQISSSGKALPESATPRPQPVSLSYPQCLLTPWDGKFFKYLREWKALPKCIKKVISALFAVNVSSHSLRGGTTCWGRGRGLFRCCDVFIWGAEDPELILSLWGNLCPEDFCWIWLPVKSAALWTSSVLLPEAGRGRNRILWSGKCGGSQWARPQSHDTSLGRGVHCLSLAHSLPVDSSHFLSCPAPHPSLLNADFSLASLPVPGDLLPFSGCLRLVVHALHGAFCDASNLE